MLWAVDDARSHSRRAAVLIVTEILEGDLESLLKKNKKLSLYTRMKMAKEAAQGIAWLHAQNPRVVHRDIKTSNFLYDKNYRIKVCDFGLSGALRAPHCALCGDLPAARRLGGAQHSGPFGRQGHAAVSWSARVSCVWVFSALTWAAQLHGSGGDEGRAVQREGRRVFLRHCAVGDSHLYGAVSPPHQRTRYAHVHARVATRQTCSDCVDAQRSSRPSRTMASAPSYRRARQSAWRR